MTIVDAQAGGITSGMKLCSVPNCGRKSCSRGWCHSHYQRFYTTGSVKEEIPLHGMSAALDKRFDTGEPISHSRLRELFDYDASTGEFIVLKRRARMTTQIGDRVGGSAQRNGYMRLSVDKREYMFHRLVWFWNHGRWPTEHIDHIDGDRKNNRIANLREATQSENNQNKKSASRRSKSGLLGVFWIEKQKHFIAVIRVNGKGKYLGAFQDPQIAYQRYLEAKRALHSHNTL